MTSFSKAKFSTRLGASTDSVAVLNMFSGDNVLYRNYHKKSSKHKSLTTPNTSNGNMGRRKNWLKRSEILK